MAFAPDDYSTFLREEKERPARTLKRLQVVRLFGLCIMWISLLIFVVLAIQPLLVYVFTAGDAEDWLEFAFEVMTVSFYPAAVALTSGLLTLLINVFCRRALRQLRAVA